MNTPNEAPQVTTFPHGTAEAYVAKMQPYHLKETDVDLITICRDLLSKSCDNNPAVMEAYDMNANIMAGKGLTTEIQRYKLNMFINSQYASLSGDISKHVGYILRQGGAEAWLSMFKSYHLPTMRELGLPVVM